MIALSFAFFICNFIKFVGVQLTFRKLDDPNFWTDLAI